MAQTHGALALTFHKTTFSIVDHTDGQIWLRGQEISAALGMANARQLSELYKSNLGEFTPSMTALVKMDTAGGPQDVRIFSLRGAHLLGMFSRTDRSAEFRRWVLDVLEHQAPLPDDSLEALRAERDALRQALLAQHPEYRQVIKYHAMTNLNQVEKARLMGWTNSNSWRSALQKLAALKLIDYKPDPRAGAQKLIAHTAALSAHKSAHKAAVAAAQADQA